CRSRCVRLERKQRSRMGADRCGFAYVPTLRDETAKDGAPVDLWLVEEEKNNGNRNNCRTEKTVMEGLVAACVDGGVGGEEDTDGCAVGGVGRVAGQFDDAAVLVDDAAADPEEIGRAH